MRVRRTPRVTGAAVIAVGVLATLGYAGTQPPPGEFDGMGLVGGRVEYQACLRLDPARCHPAKVPALQNGPQSGVLGRTATHSHAVSFGIHRAGTFGSAYLPPGRYRFFIPLLERHGCAPRPAFRVEADLSYQIIFRYAGPGRCSATVWLRPTGANAEGERELVVIVGT